MFQAVVVGIAQGNDMHTAWNLFWLFRMKVVLKLCDAVWAVATRNPLKFEVTLVAMCSFLNVASVVVALTLNDSLWALHKPSM